MSAQADSALAVIRQVARRRLWAIAWGLLALVSVDLLQLIVPRVIKYAVDDLTLGRARASTLLLQAGTILGLAVVTAGLRMAWRPLIMGSARRAEAELRQRLFDRFQDLEVGYLDRHPPGELMARASNDLNNLRMACGIGLVAAVDGTVMVLLALGFMLYISPLLTLLAVAPMPFTVILTRLQSRRMHRGYQEVQESFGHITELVREGLSGIRLVKAYGIAGRELGRLARLGRRHLELNLGLARVLGLFFPVMVLLTNLSLAIVLGLGGPLAAFGRITAGDFVAFSAYLGMLTWPVMALGWVVSLMQRASASLRRVDQVLQARPRVADPPRPLSLPPGPLDIRVRRLTFAYPGGRGPVLQGVSLAVPAGATVALVGRVAGGKSTLLRLLTRLYQPPAGRLLVGGVDVREVSQDELRRRVILVSQEAFIFSTSLRANLVLGRPRAGEEEQWQALEAAGLAEEVRGLPQGLDTRLGERGYNLSGGQRQRLALARALICRPQVLLLDDPLSAVDSQTEAAILDNLARLRAGRTTLLVSHRLAGVARARRIYVLEGGRVVEEGSHRELLSAGGAYQALFAQRRDPGGEV